MGEGGGVGVGGQGAEDDRENGRGREALSETSEPKEGRLEVRREYGA